MVAAFIERLGCGSGIEHARLADLERLCSAERVIPAKQYVSRHGDRDNAIPAFSEGWAVRYQILRNGSRQITRVLLPGDACFFSAGHDAGSSEEIVTLSVCRVAFLKTSAFNHLVATNSSVSDAIHQCGRAETSLMANAIVNVGRRDALERMAHFICEVFFRLQAVNQTTGNTFFFPPTQEDLADVLGLTPVHTNRKLQQLRQEGLIRLRSKQLTIIRLEALTRLAGFDATYLHSEIPGLAQHLASANTNPLYG